MERKLANVLQVIAYIMLVLDVGWSMWLCREIAVLLNVGVVGMLVILLEAVKCLQIATYAKDVKAEKNELMSMNFFLFSIIFLVLNKVILSIVAVFISISYMKKIQYEISELEAITAVVLALNLLTLSSRF